MSLLRKVLVLIVSGPAMIPETVLQGIVLGLYVRGYIKRRTLINWNRINEWAER